MAQGLVDFADAVRINFGHIVRTGSDADEAAGAFLSFNLGRHRRQGQIGLGQERNGPGRSGVSLGYGFRQQLGTVGGTADKNALGSHIHRPQFDMGLHKVVLRRAGQL